MHQQLSRREVYQDDNHCATSNDHKLRWSILAGVEAVLHWSSVCDLSVKKTTATKFVLRLKDPTMLKVVLPLLFAAFALTSALPVRNRFFEDVDDYKRDFVPKKTSDFYETAYDEYLRRRQPALSESMYQGSLDFVFTTLYFIVYM